jgi:hypothetical protein
MIDSYYQNDSLSCLSVLSSQENSVKRRLALIDLVKESAAPTSIIVPDTAVSIMVVDLKSITDNIAPSTITKHNL